jgi:DNA-binding response OmpR family regulator
MGERHAVLIVDDEPDIREIAALSLESVAGWQVRAASSGAEAIEMAFDERPEVILLDYMMPGLDGPATLAWLREREHRQGVEPVPVIMMTAKTQGFGRERALELGSRGLIAKPFDPMKLADQVEAILGWS